MSIALRYAAASDVGLVRANNQDSAYAGPHLLAVADGMGGHAGGDTASSIAIAKLAPLDDEALGSGEIVKKLRDTIEDARVELVRYARSHPKLAGMGTTVTALLRSGNKIAMAHMGDSRAYLLHDGELSQVTVDHTLVQHLVDTGKITPEEAEHHPQRSVVMRVLGDFEVELTPDVSMREAEVGDRWLICSDGLSGYVTFETLQRTLSESATPDEAAEKLIQLALRAGGPDNITCIVADIIDLDEAPDGSVPQPDVIVVGAAAVNRDEPSAAVDGPAARAASLAAAVSGSGDPERAGDGAADASPTEAASDEFTDESAEPAPAPRPRRRWIPWTVTVIVVALLAVAGWFGYSWTQTQYFIGTADGNVALYRGIPQSLGPISLSSVVVSTQVNADLLPEPTRTSVRSSTITAGSQAGIEERWQQIQSDIAAQPNSADTAATTGATPAAGETTAPATEPTSPTTDSSATDPATSGES
ncbi:PP2C family protein-serine/threonine phosphatase [Rarobacter incanus]|uniref:Serine/threonine protein phosphatase PstP n=1 Tax=Rarobacter incanus TaxID=153494 RepID=A0A542SPV5_9MICO|nr:PP2C family serine/threonine-protein phosphatase [Rarobacter incanus]TQK76649.1 protein phosphatase [Rarobacter incanus]